MKGCARACSLLYRLSAGAFRNEFYGFPKAANPQGSPGRVPPSPRVLHPNPPPLPCSCRHPSQREPVHKVTQ